MQVETADMAARVRGELAEIGSEETRTVPGMGAPLATADMEGAAVSVDSVAAGETLTIRRN